MSFDLLITDATVINHDGRTRAHVGIAEGQVTALLSPGSRDLPAATRTIDARGQVLIPGGVDAHCHVQQVTGGFTSLDTFAAATSAALHGGTTTIIDFGIPAGPAESPLQALENKLRLIGGARCSVALHGAVIDWDESVPEQLETMAARGVRSVKLYTTNRGTTMAEEDTIVRVMKEMARLGGLTYIHSEHDAIIADRTEAFATLEKTGIEHLHETRPAISEVASVNEVLAMAQYCSAPVYFVHQTTRAAVDAVRDARARGQHAFSETCPHYLLFDESVYRGDSPERFACCPPMRPAAEASGLVNRIARGHIDTVASDHSCYDLEQKRSHDHDVRQMPHGLPGVETRMPAAFTALVTRGGLPIERFVEVFAAAPARLNGLSRKGVIGVGYDADMVLFDPEEERQVEESALHQGTDFSPFQGLRLAGWPSTVISAGRVVLDEGGFHDPGPVGGYVPRQGFADAARHMTPEKETR